MGLRTYIEKNKENNTRLLIDRKVFWDSAKRLYEEIKDTYSFDTYNINEYSFRVSPSPNVNCGVCIKPGDFSVCISGDFCRGRADNKKQKTKQVNEVKKQFKGKVKVEENCSCGDDIRVYLILSKDWDSDEKALHDISLLCSRIFRRLR